MSIAILMLVASTLFIIEPSWLPEEEINGEVFSLDEDNSYLLMRGDETYDMYIGGNYISTIHNRNVEGICELPVYNTE
jgi:hypothetical protein